MNTRSGNTTIPGFFRADDPHPRGFPALTQQHQRAQSQEGQETDHIIQAVIPAHTGERPLEGSEGRTRRVTLIEAQLGWSVDGLNLEGLTLTCHYSATAQQKGQP